MFVLRIYIKSIHIKLIISNQNNMSVLYIFIYVYKRKSLTKYKRKICPMVLNITIVTSHKTIVMNKWTILSWMMDEVSSVGQNPTFSCQQLCDGNMSWDELSLGKCQWSQHSKCIIPLQIYREWQTLLMTLHCGSKIILSKTIRIVGTKHHI